MRNGLGVRVTSEVFTQPVLPFGRTGSSTSTQPRGLLASPGTPAVTFDDGTVGS